MTKEEFLKKISDLDMTYLAPITKEMEEYMKDYSDFEVITPGKIVVNPFSKTPGTIKFIK